VNWKYYLLIIVTLSILVACNNSENTINEITIDNNGINNSAEDIVEELNEEDEGIIFESVEEADEYLWDKIRLDELYSEIELILHEDHYVSAEDFNKLKSEWYKDNVRDFLNVGGNDGRHSNEDWEGLLEYKREGGTVIRNQEVHFPFGQVYGYESVFKSIDGTYKLVELTLLYAD